MVVLFAQSISQAQAQTSSDLANLQGLPEILDARHFGPIDEAKAKLGRFLFYDPILSGNRNISCGTCHHHDLFSADAVSLGVGEGGSGIGSKRVAGSGATKIERRVPRNAPALFNLGAHQITTLFHDGRVSVDPIFGNGFNTPAEEYLPKDLDSVLAAQALFPLTSETEMTGNPEENEAAGAAYDRIDKVWPILVKRLSGIEAYLPLFKQAYADVQSGADITISHVGNAIGAFISSEWRSFDSPFDAYLAGDPEALSEQQKQGLMLFYGKANCARCHSGNLFTDQQFHALALPPFGPGRTRKFDPIVRDVGRMGETDNLEDAYRFRTPSLRNVTLTAPYGHNGAYRTLEGIIRHHLDPLGSLEKWDVSQPLIAEAQWLESTDFVALQDRLEMQRLKRRIDIVPLHLENREVDALIAFLHSLTGKASVKGRLGKPLTVPSGLSVD